MHVRGIERLRDVDTPMLIVANHTSWWDPLLALWVSGAWMRGTEVYGMMDAANLVRHRFFRWLGAFGVDRTSRRDGARATRFAIEQLARAGVSVWVFPQGEEQPPHVGLRFHPGAAGIAKRAPRARVVPVAFSYVFEGEAAPHAYVSIGDFMSLEDGASPLAQAEAVGRELGRIARHLERRDQGFVTLIGGGSPVRERWPVAWLDRIAGWLQHWQSRSAEHRAQLPSGSGSETGGGFERLKPASGSKT